jgi:nucleotidyltransferase substrate binding protein (TIGR01987 family)
MSPQDIRWHQRLQNLKSAFNQLKDFIDNTPLNKREEQGLIQSFEYNFELSWNTIKDFYETQGESNIQGSRDAFRLAFKRGLISNGDVWMDMIKSRVLTSHTYNEKIAKQVIQAILMKYYPEISLLIKKLEDLAE